MDGPLITVERAGELLLCSRSRVFELIGEGRLARGPKFGRHTVVTLESVLALAEAAPGPTRRAPRQRTSSSSAQFDAELRAAVRRARPGSAGCTSHKGIEIIGGTTPRLT